MKVFKDRSIMQKIVILIITLNILFMFAMPNVSRAENIISEALGYAKNDIAKTAGNFAVDGLQAVCLALGDSAMSIIHKFFDESGVKSGQVWTTDDGVVHANFTLTAEKIFKGELNSLDINFFAPKSESSIAYQLRETVARGYAGLRYITIIGLMLILAYLGIKIMLETTAEGKAQYKEHLNSWLMSIFLVFFLHYIMVGSIFLTNKLTSALSTGTSLETQYQVTKNLKAKNIVEYARMMAPYGEQAEQFGYIFVYLLLVYFIIKFFWIYLKRVVYMAFLTIIAPLVALTYPLEKSKSLTRWFKEYFNMLIVQPVNLIIYVIMMSSAVSLIKTNLLYTIITLAFISNADKIFKRIFNIGETSVSNGFAKSAAAATLGGVLLNKLTSGGNDKNSKNNQAAEKPRSYDRPNTSGDTPADMYGVFARGNNSANSANSEQNSNEQNRVPTLNTPNNNRGIPQNGEYESHDNLNEVQDDMNNYDWEENGDKNKTAAGVAAGLNGKGEGEDLQKKNGIKEKENGEEDDDKFKIEPKEKMNDWIKPKKITSAKSKIGDAAKFTLKKGGQAIKTGGKVAIGAASGAAAAVSVGAIAIATGNKNANVGTAIKAATNAAKSGYRRPSESYRKVSNKRIERKYANDPEGYKQAIDRQNAKISDQEFLEDKKNEHKQVYIREFGKNQYKEKMREALEYREHGITDDKIISKAMKEKDYTQDEKIQLANIASRVKSEKDLGKVKEGLKKANVEDQKIENITAKIRQWKGFNNL